jgi:transcriptional antiterminator NusG
LKAEAVWLSEFFAAAGRTGFYCPEGGHMANGSEKNRAGGRAAEPEKKTRDAGALKSVPARLFFNMKKKYYAGHVRDRCEEAFIKRFRKDYPELDGIAVYFPKRKLREKKAGKTEIKTRPVFAGYVFFEINGNDDILRYSAALKSAEGFYRFLHSNANIAEISGRDLEIILRFIKLKNATAGISKVRFDENNKIVVTEGAMKGLEGNIVRVDRRKGRAKVRLDLYNDTFLIDLSFEAISSV